MMVWWTIVKRLPWKVLGPLMVALALAFCLRDRVQAHAKADAYARVATMVAHYSQQQEQERVRMKQQTEDSIKVLQAELVSATKGQGSNHAAAKLAAAQLRDELNTQQQAKLDSVTNHYESALVLANTRIYNQQQIVELKNKQILADSVTIASIQRENKFLHEAVKKANASSSTPWKIAAGVATVVGVVAYATK